MLSTHRMLAFRPSQVTVENTKYRPVPHAESIIFPVWNIPSVTLAPGETKKFELSVRIKPSKLEKTTRQCATQENATDYYAAMKRR